MGNQFDLIFPTLSDPKDVDPLPFWIGMRELVAKKQLRFELVDASDPRRPILRATPVRPDPKAPDRDVLITFDRARGLPVAVLYRAGRRGKQSRQFSLIEAKPDLPIPDGAFEPSKPDGWTIKYESPSGSDPGRSGSHQPQQRREE